MRGANVVMPNLTPPQYRALYEIYPDKACIARDRRGVSSLSRRRASRRSGGSRAGAAAIRRITPARVGRRHVGHGVQIDVVCRLTARDSAAAATTSSTRSACTACWTAGRTPAEVRDDHRQEPGQAAAGGRGDRRAAGGRRAGAGRGDLRRRPAAEARRLRQPHRAVRPAVRRQRVHRTTAATARSAARTARRSAARSTRTRSASRSRPWSDRGHKRLILVFGEHPHYDAEFIAECVQHVYATTRRPRRNPPREHQRRPAGPRRLPHGQGGRHRHLPDLPGDLPPRDLRPRPPGGHAQGRLPLAAGRPGPGDGGRAATTWASGPCSGCTTGGSRCWAW